MAPFKSQNMALNSYITSEGLEMGRAQVVQAQAAGCEPSVDMNPILLKPSSDVGSQVIVRVSRSAQCPRRNISSIKAANPGNQESVSALVRTVRYHRDRGRRQPAEINLKSDDIVNMGMARMAGAPVLLAGDIDRAACLHSSMER